MVIVCERGLRQRFKQHLPLQSEVVQQRQPTAWLEKYVLLKVIHKENFVRVRKEQCGYKEEQRGRSKCEPRARTAHTQGKITTENDTSSVEASHAGVAVRPQAPVQPFGPSQWRILFCYKMIFLLCWLDTHAGRLLHLQPSQPQQRLTPPPPHQPQGVCPCTKHRAEKLASGKKGRPLHNRQRSWNKLSEQLKMNSCS